MEADNSRTDCMGGSRRSMSSVQFKMVCPSSEADRRTISIHASNARTDSMTRNSDSVTTTAVLAAAIYDLCLRRVIIDLRPIGTPVAPRRFEMGSRWHNF